MNNYGLYNLAGSVAKLRGGTFTGRGGGATGSANGIHNYGTLYADAVAALGEDHTSDNFGLQNNLAGATAILRDGTFVGRGGTNTCGIRNIAALTANDVTALGENGGIGNYGLYNAGGTAALRGGSYTGSGGSTGGGAFGIWNAATLAASDLTASGDNNLSSWGLYNQGTSATITQATLAGMMSIVDTGVGPVDLSNSRLIGLLVVTPSVTCTAVSRLGVFAVGPACPP